MVTYPNLHHLQYFADAVDLGGISAAAKKNLVTHPAISRAITSLEAHLGLELLEHRKKSFVVTEAGLSVAEQARTLLAAAGRFNALHLAAGSAESVTLSIGVSRTLSEEFLFPLLRSLKEKFPAARAHVRFGTANEIAEAVAKGALDMGLTIGGLSLPTLRQVAIRSGKFLLVERGPGAREDWEAKSFIVTEPRLETELLKREYQGRFNRALPVAFEIGSWETIGQLVRQGLGVGLLPDLAVKSWKKDSYRSLRPAWFECDYEVYLHSPRAPSPNRALRHALGLFRG